MSQIVMLIEKVGGELELRLVDDQPQGDAEEGKQKQRRNHPSRQGDEEPRNRSMKELKLKRKKKSLMVSAGASAHAMKHLTGVHQTIILLDKKNVTDTVIFKCAQPFVVDVEFDPEVRDLEKPLPRRSPFQGWDIPQFSGEADDAEFPGFKVVRGTFNNDNRIRRLATGEEGGMEIDDTRPTDQRFYKATVWSEGLKLDPDWFCDR
jgi:hypothetical protein